MQISRYITPLIALVALFVLSCTSSIDESAESGEKGSILINLEVTRSSDDEQDESSSLLESGTLRIYNSGGGLVRYYKEDLTYGKEDFLAVGSYSAVFTVGTETPATFDSADISYSGESDFVVSSQKTSVVKMEVFMDNTELIITLDPTLDSHYADYSFVAYAANNADETKLTFTASATGYLILPDGEDDIEWEFWGKEITYNADGSTTTAEDATKIASKTIEGAKRAYQYKLTLKHTDYLDVSGMKITLEGTENYDDILGFKPMPTISGYGFNIDEMQDYVGSGFTLSVNSLFDVEGVSVTVGDSSYVWGVDSEVTYDSESMRITLAPNIFANIPMSKGGENIVTVTATDAKGTDGSSDMKVGITGFVGVESEDFWGNTAIMKWYVAGGAELQPSQMKMRYRKSGDVVWSDDYTASTSGDGVWRAQSAPTWSSSTVNSLEVWQLDLGYVPSADYEFQMTADDGDSDIVEYTSSDTTQIIPTVSDSSLSCYTQSNTEAEFWASGNNSSTTSLCKYESATSSAYLAATSVLFVLATGNLLTGTFEKSGLNGTASFGQYFDWQARPKSIKFTYKASMDEDEEPGCIYLAIVDWSSRHDVTAYGADNSNPDGVWSPNSQTSVDEGEIIAYAYMYISSDQSSFTEVELPVYYYDYETKPSKDFTIVISAATSYRGDYFKGSSSNEMWLKDFEFGY